MFDLYNRSRRITKTKQNAANLTRGTFGLLLKSGTDFSCQNMSDITVERKSFFSLLLSLLNDYKCFPFGSYSTTSTTSDSEFYLPLHFTVTI